MMNNTAQYQTTYVRVALAVGLAAVYGAGVTFTAFVSLFGAPQLGDALWLWLVLTVYWLAGTAIIALPNMWIYHRLGLRSWYVLTMAGGVCGFALVSYVFTGLKSPEGLVLSAGLGVSVGWIIWRIAYRRVDQTGEEI